MESSGGSSDRPSDPRSPEVLAAELAEQPAVVEAIVQQVQATWAGPLPPPNLLSDYDHLLPGSANRLMEMTEREQQHRHWMDRRFVQYRFLGQIAAAVIALAAIGGGVFLIYEGKSTAGLAIILVQVAAILAIFLVRQFTMNDEREPS